ncbi:MAG: lipid-binding SYLF domain-containing protein [Limnochordia bacterium]
MAYKKIFVCALLLILLAVPAAAQQVDQQITKAAQTLREVAEQSDAATMVSILQKSKGVAIIPSMVKAGFGLGGQYGKGIFLERDERGNWYGPAFIGIRGMSYGLQIGVQSVALVLVIANERGLESFHGGNFKLGGDVSIAAGPLGRRGEVGTDLQLEASIYSYSISRGLFAGVSLEGAQVYLDGEMNEAYWGESLEPEAIYSQKATDPRIRQVIEALEQLINN